MEMMTTLLTFGELDYNQTTNEMIPFLLGGILIVVAYKIIKAVL